MLAMYCYQRSQPLLDWALKKNVMVFELLKKTSLIGESYRPPLVTMLNGSRMKPQKPQTETATLQKDAVLLSICYC